MCEIITGAIVVVAGVSAILTFAYLVGVIADKFGIERQ